MIVYYRCPNCKAVSPVQRQGGKLRKKNHPKSIKCWKCNKKNNHKQV